MRLLIPTSSPIGLQMTDTYFNVGYGVTLASPSTSRLRERHVIGRAVPEATFTHRHIPEWEAISTLHQACMEI